MHYNHAHIYVNAFFTNTRRYEWYVTTVDKNRTTIENGYLQYHHAVRLRTTTVEFYYRRLLTFRFSKFLTFFSIAVKHIFRGVSPSDAAIFR